MPVFGPLQAEAPLANQCFTIFEGGGAKGITHIGALKAFADVGLARIGAAGTSAGAIIAALTAVGYSADELFDPLGTSNILSARGETPIDLLGRDDWGVFSTLRGSARPNALTGALHVLRRWIATGTLTVCPPALPIWVFCLARSTRWPPLFGCAWRVLEHFGFFSTEGARDILNDILRRKLCLPSGTHVCFRDIDPVDHPLCCRLKIITTNLATGSLELFDHTTPDVVVADAVAASFSIPIFFKPSSVRRLDVHGVITVSDKLYVDGGLVSNLPVWVFFEDKKFVERLPANRNTRPIPIVAFTLDSGAQAGGRARASTPIRAMVAYIEDVVRTGVFGGQSIAQNFVTHLTVVDMPTPLTVIQFDCTAAQALAAYQSGRDAASTQLRRVFQINPAARQQVLEELVDGAMRRSEALRGAANQPSAFRACLLRRLGNSSFKIVASLNMDGDTDDDLVLDPSNPGGPTAYLARDFEFVDMTANPDLRMTKYEQALVRKTLASVIAVPIFDEAGEWAKTAADRREPAGAFCIDSDSDLGLEFQDAEFMRALALGSVRFAPFMVFERETS